MDPIIATALALVFGLVALLSGIAAVAIGLAEWRVPWKTGGVAAVSAAIVLGCAMAMPPAYHPDEQARIERLHAQFAPALERYRQTNGVYPPALQAAGITPPQTEYGPLRYHAWPSCDGGAPCYEVSFGDYYDNGFTASFNSRRGKWSLDT